MTNVIIKNVIIKNVIIKNQNLRHALSHCLIRFIRRALASRVRQKVTLGWVSGVDFERAVW